jgi:hypothetical protein
MFCLLCSVCPTISEIQNAAEVPLDFLDFFSLKQIAALRFVGKLFELVPVDDICTGDAEHWRNTKALRHISVLFTMNL